MCQQCNKNQRFTSWLKATLDSSEQYICYLSYGEHDLPLEPRRGGKGFSPRGGGVGTHGRKQVPVVLGTPSWEYTQHLPTCGALAGKGQLSLWEQGQAMSCPTGERSRSPNTSPHTLTTGTLEDRCPAVHPNARRGYFPGIWKRPWSQQLSQHMHGTCATVPLTCPVPVLAWPVLICPHLPAPSGVDHPGDPHLPLAWPSLSGIPISHLGSPHPLGPLIGFKSGGKNRVWP